MNAIIKKFIQCFSLACLIISFSCENQKKSNKEYTPKAIGTTNKLNKWNINSVCECYDKGLSQLDMAYEIRSSYNSFERYNKNKIDVKKVKKFSKEFRSIQSYCLQSYKRAMFENNCDPESLLKNKQDSLFDLGIQISKY